MPRPQTSCHLYLVVEAAEGARGRLAATLEAANIATILIAPAGGHALDAGAARPLVEEAHRAGIASLVAGDPALARVTRADGVHLPWTRDPLGPYRQARAVVGAQQVVGAAAGVSRHDAMTLAEAGADYVAFGAPANLRDRDRGRQRRDELVAWWAEIFQVPCVAFDVETAAEAETLARAGADFVAATLAAGLSPADARTLAAEFAAAIGASAQAA